MEFFLKTKLSLIGSVIVFLLIVSLIMTNWMICLGSDIFILILLSCIIVIMSLVRGGIMMVWFIMVAVHTSFSFFYEKIDVLTTVWAIYCQWHSNFFVFFQCLAVVLTFIFALIPIFHVLLPFFYHFWKFWIHWTSTYWW